MNVTEASQKWNCSKAVVRSYCAAGIIPPAEKDERGRWMIPDDCEKPPCTRFRLCYLMDMINQLKEGVAYHRVKWGMSDKEVKAGYQYLVEYAMISSVDVQKLETELYRASVTSRGRMLMERENAEGSSQRKFNLKFKMDTGIFSFETGYESTKGK